MTIPVGNDWLNVVFPVSEVEAIRAYITPFLGQGESSERGVQSYAQSVRFESKAIIAWSPDRPDAWVSLNADSLSLFTADQQLELMQFLLEHGGRCSRIDCRADLPRDLFKLDDVHAAASSGQVMAFKLYDPRRPRDLRTGELTGDSAYFGRRGSDGGGKFVRAYDKFLESGGQIDANRLEVEFAGERAAQVMEVLASSRSVDRMREKIANYVGGSIDFREKREAAHHHVDRMQRLSWWQSVLDALGESVIKINRATPPLQATLEYLDYAWCSTLALAADVIDFGGHDGQSVLSAMLARMIDKGRTRNAKRKRLGKPSRPGARDLGLDVEFLLSM